MSDQPAPTEQETRKTALMLEATQLLVGAESGAVTGAVAVIVGPGGTRHFRYLPQGSEQLTALGMLRLLMDELSDDLRAP